MGTQVTTQVDSEGIANSGHGAAVARDGGIALAGTGNENVLGTLFKARDVKVTNIGLQSDAVEKLVGKVTQASTDQIKEFAAASAAKDTILSTLAQNQQTGGNLSQDKIVGWLALAALGVLAVVMLWRK